MLIPEENDRPDSVTQAARTIHSEKPKVVCELIETMHPNTKYLNFLPFPSKIKNGACGEWKLHKVNSQHSTGLSKTSQK